MNSSLKTSLLFLLPCYVFGASRFVCCCCQSHFSSVRRRNKTVMQLCVMLGCRPRQVVKHIKGNFLFKSCLPNSALKLSFCEETEGGLCSLQMILVSCNTKHPHFSLPHFQHCSHSSTSAPHSHHLYLGEKKVWKKAGIGWLQIYTLRMWEHGLDRAGSGYGQMAGTCDCGNELSGSIKRGGISWRAENLLASQEGLYSME